MHMLIPVAFGRHEFTLACEVSRRSGMKSGVLIDPISAEPADHEWVSALQSAIALYPYVYSAVTLIDYLPITDDTHAQIAIQKDSILQRIVERWKHYKSQSQWVSDHEDEIAELVSLVQFEIARRNAEKEKAAADIGTMAQPDDPGYVYLIRSISGHYKIGHSRNPSRRTKTFEVKLPFEVEFICTIETNEMRALETSLHRRYKSKRVNGEWFALTSDDVEYIKRLAVRS